MAEFQCKCGATDPSSFWVDVAFWSSYDVAAGWIVGDCIGAMDEYAGQQRLVCGECNRTYPLKKQPFIGTIVSRGNEEVDMEERMNPLETLAYSVKLGKLWTLHIVLKEPQAYQPLASITHCFVLNGETWHYEDVSFDGRTPGNWAKQMAEHVQKYILWEDAVEALGMPIDPGHTYVGAKTL